MSLRILLVCLPAITAACAAAPSAPPVDPARAARMAQCADENPLDRMAQLGCESDRARLVASRSPVAAPARSRPAAGAPVVLVVPAAPVEPAGQGLTDYGRALAAGPVRCTSLRMGAFVSTSCR